MNFTKRERNLIYFALIIGFVAVYYQYYLSPKLLILGKINDEISHKKVELSSVSMLNPKKLDDSLLKINNNLKELNQEIPDNKDIESFVINLDTIIAVTGVKLNDLNFESTDLNQNQASQNQSNQDKKTVKNYVEIPVNINVSGKYIEISSFVDKIQNLKRLNSIQALDISRDKASNQLILNMKLFIYSIRDKGTDNVQLVQSKGKSDPFKPLIEISKNSNTNLDMRQNQINSQNNLQDADVNKIITDSINNTLINILKRPQQPSSSSGGKKSK